MDDAIDTATRHTREAEERLRGKPIESPEIVTDARTVERRTDDLHELARDAAEEAEPAE